MKGPQCHPTYAGGARPKVPAQPSAGQSQSQPWPRRKEEPDPINHPCRWIHAEMEKTIWPHWWKELKASGRVSMGIHLIKEGPSDSEAQQQMCWQVVAFRLPLAQHETSGWWDAPPWISGLCSADFILHTGAPGPRDFRAVKQEKTLAIAWVLWACTKGLGVPTGILCELAWVLQKHMAPQWPLVGMT